MTHTPNRFLHKIAIHPALFVTILVLILLALIGLTYRQARQLALEHTERALDDRVNTHKYYLQDALGKFTLVPEIVAASPLVKQMMTQPDAQNIDSVTRFLDEISHNTQADRIFIMNAEGTALTANTGTKLPPIIGNSYAKRPYFQKALAGGTGHFIGVGMTSHVLGYFISRPVKIDNKVHGVVAVRVSLSLEVFRSVLKQYLKDNGEVALIADEHGVVFMTPIDRWMYRTITPLPAAAIKEIEGSRQYADQKLQPLPMKVGGSLTEQLRFVRFADIPNHVFLQKSYSIGEIGDRLYLHVNASKYWEPIISYMIIALVLALATLIIAIVTFQRWCYRTKLLESAIRDPLTGLYTRLYMNEWIQAALRAHQRDESAGFALVIFDLDNFKRVNDTYGHLVGDAVLKEVGAIISSSVRAQDMAVRYGGEELAVFVRFSATSEVLTLAERVRSKLEESGVQTEAGLIAITASAGVAFHAMGESSDELFARADEKLYEAKKQGRNRICT